MTSVVYFISNGKSIKVGRTTNLRKRIYMLQNGSAFSLQLIGNITGGDPEEKSAHYDLRSYRERGEWFTDCPETRAIIGRLLADGFTSAPVLLEPYSRPAPCEVSTVEFQFDPHRLARLDAELTALRAERMGLELIRTSPTQITPEIHIGFDPPQD